MKRLVLMLIIFAISLTLVAGCSSSGGSGPDDDDDTTAESIGPDGGEIELNGHARLTVPVGALGDTVDFTIEENGSPTPAPQGKQFCSSCVSIEPSGTDFTVPATVTVEYDPGDLGGANECDVVIYTDDGRGWAALTTMVDENDNEASANVSHLSDFAAIVDTVGGGTQADGVFTALRMHRGITYMEFASRDSMIIMSDFLVAWFDSTVALCSPSHPIMVDSVWCENGSVYPLEWSAMETMYKYMPSPMLPFLTEGETYTFQVVGGPDAANLTASVDFPESTPYITSPLNLDVVSLSGFSVTWEGSEGPGDLNLAILPTSGMEDGVFVVTANDGDHTFSSGDLSGLPSGAAAITLNYFNRENINVQGYDSDSYIEAKVTHGIVVTLE